MPRQRITLALLHALIDANVAIDANHIPERNWQELLMYHTPDVLAVSHGANGANGALFVVFGRLYALTRRDGRLLQVISIDADAPSACVP